MKQPNLGTWPLGLTVVATLSSCGGGPIDPSSTVAAPQPRAAPGVREKVLPAPATYRLANRRNPFQPPIAAAHAEEEGALRPDMERRKAPLERFALDELQMVGTLAGRGATHALIRDPQGRIHALRPGDFLGMDHGRVATVHAGGVDLVETVRDAKAGWTQRMRHFAVLAAEHSRATDVAEASHGS